MFTGNLREATRSLHVSYPVPFFATVLLICGLIVLGMAGMFSGWLSVLAAVFAGILFLVSIGFFAWALFFKPYLLKSERYVFLDKMMAVLGDSDMDAAARERLQTTMLGSLAEKHSEKPTRLSHPATHSDEDLEQ